MLDTWKTFSRYRFEEWNEAVGGEAVSIYLKPGIHYGTFATYGYSMNICGYVCEFQNEAKTGETFQKANNETTKVPEGSLSLAPLQPKSSHMGKQN